LQHGAKGGIALCGWLFSGEMMAFLAERDGRGGADSEIRVLGLAAFAALVAVAAVFFMEGLGELGRAWQMAEYSHGPIIPFLSLLLFLRQLKTLPPHPGHIDDRWAGFGVLALALLFGLLGKIARIPDIVAYALILFVAGVMLMSLGWRRGRAFWPAVVHLAFMLPLPATLYWKVSSSLQLTSSEFGVWLIGLFGIPVYLDGNIIDLGVYKLHVAEACSGLRYLFPVMSFSYVFATLYRGPVWHKAVLLLAAAPLTVLMNSVRIGMIGVIVNSYGLEHVEGVQHLLEGWVIFITCIVMLFGLARAMLWLQGSSMTLSEALDLDLGGLGPQIARIRLIQPSFAMLAGLALTLAVTVAWHATPSRADLAIDRKPFALMSPALGDWRLLRTSMLEQAIERTLGADDYYSASYVADGEAAQVELFMAWYADQTRGGIHSPEVCLPGGGWEMERIERIDIADQLDVAGPFPVNRAIIQKGETRLLVYYWFEQYGGRKAWDFAAKAALLRDAVVHGRTDGGLVRVITPVLPGATIADADQRILDLVRPLLREIRDFVPQLRTE
jgi:exosortase D (VPLPA-CTERM-specific)